MFCVFKYNPILFVNAALRSTGENGLYRFAILCSLGCSMKTPRIKIKPFVQRRFQHLKAVELPTPEQVLLDGSHNSFRIGVLFRIAVTGKKLLNIERITLFNKAGQVGGKQ